MSIDYGYPLYDVRTIRDLKDMVRQSVEHYGSRDLFLVKDPRAIGEPAEFDNKGKAKKSNQYLKVTFERFDRDIRALGTWILQNVSAKARIAILAETRYEWYVTYLATVNGDQVVVPLDKELPQDEVRSLLERSEAEVVFFSGEKKELVERIKADLPNLKKLICMDPVYDPSDGQSVQYFWDILQQGRDLVAAGDHSFDQVEIDPFEMRILLFTSGTTAQSKAVMLCHNNIAVNLMAMCQMTYIDENDTFLSVLPIHHTYECTCGFLCQVYRGCSIAVCDGLRYITQNMQEAKVTMILVVPLMLEAFYRRIMKAAHVTTASGKKFELALSITRLLRRIGIDARRTVFKQVHDNFGGHLRLLISGGAAIEPEILKGMQDLGFACHQGYGLTECAPILALNRDKKFNDRAAGLPMPGVEMKIINQDEEGIGEICGKGPNVMLGYYQDPEKTAAAIDQDGFYHTGDLGYLDEDGFVIITGRKANLIVTKNGKNIFPEEIEFLLSRYDLVGEVVVLAKRNERDDIDVHAEIFPSAEALANYPELADQALTSDAVRKQIGVYIKEVNQQLVNYKHIKSFGLRDTEFEKTTSKKIRRSKVKLSPEQ